MNKIDSGQATSGSGRSGFTLIEVLIALVVLGIALIPLLTAQAGAIRGYRHANNAAYETELAKSLMSNVLLEGNIAAVNKNKKIKGVKGYLAHEVIKTTTFPGIYVIKVTVFKKDGNPADGVSLRTLTM